MPAPAHGARALAPVPGRGRAESASATRAPASRDDEAALVRAILDGDEAAFALLFDGLHAGLVALARMYVASPADAEEAVQEGWMAALDALPRFEGRSTLKTWVSRIVIHQALKRATRESRSLPLSALENPERAVDRASFGPRGTWLERVLPWSPERSLSSAQLGEQVAAAIDALPPAQRTVVVLRHVEQWTAAEVCEALHISAANQRVLLHRGRSRLRASLDRLMKDVTP